MYIRVLLLPWSIHAIRLARGNEPAPATPSKVFHVTDTPNFEALMLSAFRGASTRKLPEPFQSGIESIDLQRAVHYNKEGRNETDLTKGDTETRGDMQTLGNETKTETHATRANETSGDENKKETSKVTETAALDERRWWQRLLHRLSPSFFPSPSPPSLVASFFELPSREGVWDELDDLAAKSGLVHGGTRPYAFQYDIPHGDGNDEKRLLWIDTLNHSVLAIAHGPNFPIVLALFSLCGGSMLVTLITLLSSPFGKFGDIIRIMNITLYGVLGALLAMYFKCGKVLTALLTMTGALFPILLATRRLPAVLTQVTGGLGRFIDLETFLAVRLSVTIFSSLCVQGILSIALVVFGSDRLSEHIARHLASSQILFVSLLSLIAALTIIPVIYKLQETEKESQGMPLTGKDFAYLNTLIHIIVSLAFGVVVVGTISHLHNYLVFTTHKGEIMLFDPLIFFVPFSTSLFRWFNLLSLLGVWVTSGFVFLATADKAWVLRLDNSFGNPNNDLIESLNGTLREETIHDDEDDHDLDLLLVEPTPRIAPPPDATMIPPSPPSELENFITPLSP